MRDDFIFVVVVVVVVPLVLSLKCDRFVPRKKCTRVVVKEKCCTSVGAVRHKGFKNEK